MQCASAAAPLPMPSSSGPLTAANHSHRPAVENRNEAQRAPSARPGFSMPFRRCAQSPRVRIAKPGGFPAGFHKCDGLKNRRLGQCKISKCEVLISVTLSVRGEVAERLKAAVC